MTASPSENSRSVLIAEDNANTRRFLKKQLELLGYEVVGAVSNGQDAVDLATEVQPSLVILDIKMPEMDGIEAAKGITAHYPVPIILITGVSSEEVAARAIEAGIFAYLVKPITKKQLEPAIKLAHARFMEFQSLNEEVNNLRDAIEARKLIERAKGILMTRCNIGEDDAFKLLQAHSQKENKKMKEIAEMVISASKLI